MRMLLFEIQTQKAPIRMNSSNLHKPPRMLTSMPTDLVEVTQPISHIPHTTEPHECTFQATTRTDSHSHQNS
jgi:hypothetical protein